MPSDERTPFEILIPVPRHARSCSDLPKSRDDLSWAEAVALMERTGQPSYFREKLSLIQRKFQAVRPVSRSNHNQSSREPFYEQRAHRRLSGANLIRMLRDEPTHTRNRRKFQGPGEPRRYLSPDDATDWEYSGTQIAFCLPPAHLEGPPPPYTPRASTLQPLRPDPQPRFDLLQTQRDELFFQPPRLRLVIPPYRGRRYSSTSITMQATHP